MCGGVNPSNPPPPAKGFAPPGNAATLRSPQGGSVAPDIRSHASTWTAIKSFPYEGKGDRSAVDEVTCGPAPLRERPYPLPASRQQKTTRYRVVIFCALWGIRILNLLLRKQTLYPIGLRGHIRSLIAYRS